MTARASGSKPAKETVAVAPMSFGKRKAPAKQERVPLFELDGVVYDMPAVVPTGEALIHLAMVNGMPNEAMRGLYLLQHVAGQAAFNALLDDAEITPGAWQKLIRIMSDRVFGQLEAPGN